MRVRLLVGAARTKGVIHVGYRHYSGREWNLFSQKAVWISVAIPSLVMMPDDLHRDTEKSLKAETSLNTPERLGAELSMQLHLVKLVCGELPRFTQDRIGNTHLADIVERGCSQ